MASPTAGFADYGRTLASLAEAQPITSPAGSLNTPGLDDHNLASARAAFANNRHQSMTIDGAYKIDRFRFDASSTDNFINEQQQRRLCSGQSGCTNGVCQEHGACSGPYGSYGNLHHHIPHTSCTSIAQNLSTNDQQPLIVETQHERCHHQHNNGSYLHSTQNLASASQNHCCSLRTTSFMAAAPSPNCVCCEQELKGGGGGGGSGGGLEAIYSTEQRKSRTLTRVYKPLNDIQTFPDAPTSTNLVDNFYIPPADLAQSSTNNHSNHL